MTFVPVVPFAGLSGWAYLNRTRETLQEAFNNQSQITRETEYFKNHIGDISTAKELVEDRTLLKVALGAFGLDDDIGNRFFIQKILEEGTLATTSLANKLSDKRYFELSKAFGFGDLGTANTKLSDFSDGVINKYTDRQFETAVGQSNPNLRLALSLERDLTAISNSKQSETAKWFTVMGNPPIRSVFETAFALPPSFSSIDLDRQLDIFQDRARGAFGESSISQFASREKQENLIERFLVQAQLNSTSFGLSNGNIALAILQSNPLIR